VRQQGGQPFGKGSSPREDMLFSVLFRKIKGVFLVRAERRIVSPQTSVSPSSLPGREDGQVSLEAFSSRRLDDYPPWFRCDFPFCLRMELIEASFSLHMGKVVSEENQARSPDLFKLPLALFPPSSL